MGITRHPIRVRLSSHSGPTGMMLWTVSFTVSEHGRESSFTTEHVAEAAARRMVENLLADRLSGLSVEEVYSEELG